MKLGVGTDIIEVERIREAIRRHGKRLLDRLFTEKEQAYCERYADATAHYAGRFAAKEAIAKALGTGFGPEVAWNEIEIMNDDHGKPIVLLSNRLKVNHPKAHVHLSISHCNSHATATAILTS